MQVRTQSSITLKQVRAFITTAQTKSFAEAAALLSLSQPALSSAIKNLEEAIGGQLLVRTTRSSALTPEGERFLPVAQRLLREWDTALDDLHNSFALHYGKISIAAMPSFAGNLLPSAIRQFRLRHPDISIALHDVVAEEVVAMVRQGRVELGISFNPGEYDDLSFQPLFSDRFIAVLPKGHTLLQQQVISGAELITSELIALQEPSLVRRLIQARFQDEGLQCRPAFEAHQLATVGRMVANGLGVSIVPALCENQMQELGAECRPLNHPIISQQVGLLTRRRHPLSAAGQAISATLARVFGQTLENQP